MADDVVYTTTLASPPDATRVSAEEVSTLNAGAVTAQKVQRIAQVVITANGTAVDVTSSAPLPVVQTGTPTLPTGAATAAEQATQTASLSVIDDWDESDRAKVNPIVGQAGVAAGAGAVAATVQRVTLASDDPAVVSLAALDNAVAGNELQVDVVAALPAGTNNIGDVDVLTLPALPAGTNNIGDVDVLTLPNVTIGTMAALVAGTANIGDVDVLTVPAPLSTTGGGTEATALRVTVANDSTGVLSVDDNGGSLTVDGTVAVSGTVTVGSHAVTNAGTFAVQADSVIPGTGATNLGKAVDSVPGATDTGIAMLAVRDDVLAALTPADGDYTHLRVSSTGALHVTGAGGGTQYTVDDAASATATVTMTGVVRKDSAASLAGTDGDVSALQVDANGALRVTGGGGGTEYVVNAVAPADPTGATFVMERDDALSALSEVEGDWTQPRASANGALWVAVDGTVTVGSHAVTNAGTFAVQVSSLPASTNTLEVVGDAAHDAALSGNPLLMGGASSAAAPTDVSGDGEVVRSWHLRNGAQATVITAAGALIPGDATNGLDVDVTRVSGTVTIAGAVTNAGTFATQVDGSALTALQLIDDPVFADDAAFTVGTSKVMAAGVNAIPHGDPDSADAGDAVIPVANRDRVLWTIGGHPNAKSATYITTAAGTDDNVLAAIVGGTVYGVTRISVFLDEATTVGVGVRLGFGTANVPALGASQADAVDDILCYHPGLVPGSGFTIGDGSGVLGVGGDGAELRITNEVPTSGTLSVTVTYFPIAS